MEALPDIRSRESDQLARYFRYFGEVECPRMQASVYQAYSLGIATDPDLLSLVAEVDPGQPAPNVLFAAVQDLLFEDAQSSREAEALSAFYPAVSGGRIPDRSPWEPFRNFCLAHAQDLLPKLRTGRTQTCVVHRCAVVLPALAALPRIEENDGRIALLEIGPSAGLNLRLDHYRYDYGGGLVWGDPEARPILRCEVRGDFPPPIPGKLEVVARRGMDVHPIDLEDPEEIRWLRALIWPEHAERARVMIEALALAKSVPAQIEKGDATCEIAELIHRLPTNAARVLFATHVIYQIPREGRLAMLGQIAEASRETPVDLIIVESTGRGDSHIDWFSFANGQRTSRTTLGSADSHGRWIEWGTR